MTSFLRCFFRRRSPHRPPVQSRRKMSAQTSAILYAASVATPSLSNARPEDDTTKNKRHHVGKHFDNPWDSWRLIGVWEIMSAMIGRRVSGKANIPDTTPPTVPVKSPEFLPSRKDSQNLRATWLGHACYYVEFPGGLKVLFDPVFTDRCSPLSWFGPKRFTAPPCQIKGIPIIDAVVISHNHYDHLSHPTVTEISHLHPNCHFFAPLGNRKWFLDCGITNVTEMDWWDEVDFTLTPTASTPASTSKPSISSTEDTQTPSSPGTITARISCLPSQHISSRSLFDRAATLWASWSISSPSPPPLSSSSSSRKQSETAATKSVYFAGDTGYRSVPRSSSGQDDWSPAYSHLPHCPAFADIGRLRGPFDLGLIPIGAYEPRFIMSPMHANPRDAVEIFRDVRCHRALAMHWGTWVLTEEDVLEPPRLLREALKFRGVDEVGVFDVCDVGDSREF